MPVHSFATRSSASRAKIADDDEHLVVGHIALVVKVDDRLVRRAIEDFEISDDRAVRGVDGVDRAVEHLVQHAAALDLVVGQLSPHDAEFAGELARLEADVLHRVGQQLDRGHHVLRRAVDVERRHVVARVGVRGAAEIVDDPLDFRFRAAGGGASADDVFEDVAQSRAEMAALVDAAGVLHEAANRRHRGNVVLLDDHRQAIVQHAQRDVVAQGADARVTGRRGGGCDGRLGAIGFHFAGFGRRERNERPEKENGDAIRSENVSHAGPRGLP